MDFQKACDKVPHKRLIGKLHSYGINTHIVNWLEAFLSNRKQKVVVNGAESIWYNVISEIPQGSVIGPLLFIIYINYMPKSISSEIYLFTKIFRHIQNRDDHIILQHDLDKLTEWSNKWLLKFHPDKCKHMTTYDLAATSLQHVHRGHYP